MPERIARILVKTDEDWLTNDGDTTEEEGWEDVKKQYLLGSIPLCLRRYLTTEFIEWER